MTIFQCCSSGINKADIGFHGLQLHALPGRDVRQPMPLMALEISDADAFDGRIHPILHPFTVSHLRALTITEKLKRPINWLELALAINTIDILYIMAHARKYRAQADIVTTLLSTIPPVHHIHTIIVGRGMRGIPGLTEVLDSVLAPLPLPTIEIEMRGRRAGSALFPRFNTNEMICPKWWEWNRMSSAGYQISAESDGLIGSYGIADRDPKRGDINFLSIGPLASFAIAISPPFLPRSTTLGARSDPPMLAFHLKRSWTATD
ncbi:hypothetical protein DFH09DRAFT_1110388 [Mycena vulgaris]|nr:hypothetical protein DFH09DRAFT_1110388 [Mycena vulgaris]